MSDKPKIGVPPEMSFENGMDMFMRLMEAQGLVQKILRV